MKSLVSLLLFLSLATLIVAQTKKAAKVRDVNGWGKINWGMTADDVRKTCSSEFKEDINLDNKLIGIRLNPIKIGDLNLDVIVHISDESRVNQVELSHLFDPHGRITYFDTVKSLLIEKYGLPTNEDRKSEHRATVLWVFPLTRISLNSYEMGGLDIIYLPVEKNPL